MAHLRHITVAQPVHKLRPLLRNRKDHLPSPQQHIKTKSWRKHVLGHRQPLRCYASELQVKPQTTNSSANKLVHQLIMTWKCRQALYRPHISYYMHISVCQHVQSCQIRMKQCVQVYMKQVNVKSSLWTAWRHTGEEVYFHSFLTSITHGLIGRLHVTAALSPDKQSHHSFNTSLGRPQDQCGLFGGKYLPLRGTQTRFSWNLGHSLLT